MGGYGGFNGSNYDDLKTVDKLGSTLARQYLNVKTGDF